MAAAALARSRCTAVANIQRAGYRLTVIEHGTSTAKWIVLYLLALCPVTLLMVPWGLGMRSTCGLRSCRGCCFWPSVSTVSVPPRGRWARALFSGSLLYLMVIAVALVVPDHAWLLSPSLPAGALTILRSQGRAGGRSRPACRSA